MENDCGGPDFAYAYGGEETWNPATRPDHAEDLAEGGTTKPHDHDSRRLSTDVLSKQPTRIERPDEKTASDPTGGADADPAALFGATADDGFFERPRNATQTGSSADVDSKHSESVGDGPSQSSAPRANSRSTAALQDDREALPAPETAAGMDAREEDEPDEQPPHEARGGLEKTTVDVHSPSENYERQGETTFLEQAVHENVQAPLVSDTDPPTADWGTSDVDFDLAATQSRSAARQDQAAAAMPLSGDMHSQGLKVEGSAGTIDWGNSADHEFNFSSSQVDVPSEDLFTERDPAAEGAKPAAAGAGTKDQSASQGNQQDLDALWKAVLEDDDLLLDDEDSPGNDFFVEDGDGFLKDSDAGAPEPPPKPSAASKYAPSTRPAPQPSKNPYTGQGPQFVDPSQPGSRPGVAQGQVAAVARPYSQPPPNTIPPAYQQPPTRPPISSAAESFADKAKGGYHSPFDLPDDLSKPRKRPVHHTPPVGPGTPPVHPARSSSLYSSSTAPLSRPPPSNVSAASLSPPSSSHSMKAPPVGPAGTDSVRRESQSSASKPEFFAELPVVTKARHSMPPRYTPHAAPTPPPSRPPPVSGRVDSWPMQREDSQSSTVSLTSQLRPPELLPVFPENATVSPLPVPPPGRSASLSVPSSASRYSPAPPSAPAVHSRYSPAPAAAPSLGSRYSPAPPSGPSHNRYASEPAGPPKSQALPFAPRTSSPLTHQSILREDDLEPKAVRNLSNQYRHDGLAQHPPLEDVSELDEQRAVANAVSQAPPPRASVAGKPATPPPPKAGSGSAFSSPRKRLSNYAPQQYAPPPAFEPSAAPPRRSQSQSPGTTMKGPKFAATTVIERPASVHGLASPPQRAPVQAANSVLPGRRQFSADMTFIAPTDETAEDPLGRWKRGPTVTWGHSGSLITSFPVHTPRYGAGGAKPMIKCSPGEIKILSVKTLVPLDEHVAKFPGPLKSKSKKKDTVAWLKTRIEQMEREAQPAAGYDLMSPMHGAKRLEEKILLWKTVQLLVEHDGRLEGTPAVDQAVKGLLSPELGTSPGATPALTTGADLMAAGKNGASAVQADSLDSAALEQLRVYLSKGDREKAVWHCVDRRLWGHALLLSSTLSRDLWKQVVQEFVRQEVKKMGPDTHALAALYQIFAGNFADSVDELVPASAQAGFQMVSKSSSHGAMQNAFEGLDRWRETLVLVLSNRTDGDVEALKGLGELLARYGRVEAAHVCHLFARSAAYFGGSDDPASNVVLLGADHLHQRLEVGKDTDPVLLTEVYEFALSLTSPPHPPIPHLQAYKLNRAYTLAETGHRPEAQQYCDAIAAAFKSTTKHSPYYHIGLLSELDDLSKRLSQSPKDGSSSWISKPSMDKVSGSMLAKFNSFIAGDDSDAASTTSGTGNEVGPFAKIAGSTPTISPSHSNADLYGSYRSTASVSGASAPPVNPRYAPTSAYAPRTSLDSATRPRYEPAGRSSIESTSSAYAPRRDSEPALDARHPEPVEGFVSPAAAYSSPPFSPQSQVTQPPKQNAYQPNMPSLLTMEAKSLASQLDSSDPYKPTAPPDDATPVAERPPLSAGSEPFQSAPSRYAPLGPDSIPPNGGLAISNLEAPASSTYEPPQPSAAAAAAAAPSLPKEQQPSGPEPPPNSYEPPAGGYEPPSYQPYEPERSDDDDGSEQGPPDGDKPRKKSFLDDEDDNDLAARAAKLAEEERKHTADEQADEAFRKAAQADAAKAKQAATAGRGWFGSWFKKDPSPASGPIRAKLGEQNSFVYDPELKRWINKAAGGDATPTPTPTPPPPKGLAPRSTSGGAGPPFSSSLPPARQLASNSQRSSSMPPASRSGTPARTASPAPGGSTPSTLAPPTANGPPSRPPSRPPTGMSEASSIDDLLGAPQARKGGTVRRGKRSGRYVDVMGTK